MSSAEDQPLFLFSADRPASLPSETFDPYQDVLSRYAILFGHRDSLSLSQAKAAIALADLPDHIIPQGLDNFARKYFYDPSLIPPDAIMYFIDRELWQPEIANRFGWENGIQLHQVITLLAALDTNKDRHQVHAELVASIVQRYPSLKETLSADTNIFIPGEIFISAWEELDPADKTSVENGIAFHRLTPTEYAVLVQIVKGLGDKKAASALDKDGQTFRHEAESMRQKLAARNRTEAAFKALYEKAVPVEFIAPYVSRKQLESFTLLTRREEAALNLLAVGYRNKEIATLLEISPHTVRIHLHSVFKKLRVKSRTQAAIIYYVNELTSAPKI